MKPVLGVENGGGVPILEGDMRLSARRELGPVAGWLLVISVCLVAVAVGVVASVILDSFLLGFGALWAVGLVMRGVLELVTRRRPASIAGGRSAPAHTHS